MNFKNKRAEDYDYITKNYHYLIDHGDKVFQGKVYSKADIFPSLLNLKDEQFFEISNFIKNSIRRVLKHLDKESKFQFMHPQINSPNALLKHQEGIYGMSSKKRNLLLDSILALSKFGKLKNREFKAFGKSDYFKDLLIMSGDNLYEITYINQSPKMIGLRKNGIRTHMNTPDLESILNSLKEESKNLKTVT